MTSAEDFQPRATPQLLPTTVDGELMRLSGLLDTVTNKLAQAAEEEAEAEATWKVAEAKALLVSTQKTADLRGAEALMLNEDAFRRRLMTKAYRDGFENKARSFRSQLECLRTIAANLRGMA